MRFVGWSFWLCPGVAFAGVSDLSFAPNHGQAEPEVAYVARGGGAVALLLADGAAMRAGDRVVRLRFDDGQAREWIPGSAAAPATYVRGDGSSPVSVPTFARVRAEDVWTGVDVVWHGGRGELEYDLVVAPHVDPDVIHLTFDGADAITVDEHGELVVTSGDHTIRQRAPVAWQSDGTPVTAAWVLKDRNVSFVLGERNLDQGVTIDPVIVYEVQWTGPNTVDFGNEEALDIAVDKQGNAYVTGYTTSTDFPTTTGGPLEGLYDAFVVKLDPDGDLLWSTFLGGGEDEQGRGIGVDAAGSPVVMGRTNSTDFPTVNAFQGSLSGGSDAFVTKLTPDGTTLVYSTYLGGASWEIGDDGNVLFRLFNGDVDSDAQGNAYVTGDTNSLDFPVSAVDPIQGKNGGGPCVPACEDAFAVKLDTTGQLVWGTYLGGDGVDRGYGITVDRKTGEAVLSGEAVAGFPTTPGSFQPVAMDFDLFVTKIAADGSALVWSTFLGGNSTEFPGNELALGGDGSVYVTGTSLASNYPTTPGVFQPKETPFGDFDAVLTHLAANGSMIWSTYIGGLDDEEGNGIDVDKKGRVVITGQTTSGGTYPEVENFAGCTAAELLTMTELSPNGSKVRFSSCIPSSGFRGNALAIRGDSQFAAGSSHAGPGAVEATVLRVDDFLPGVADIAVQQFDTPDPVPNEQTDLTYTITVENLGPERAGDVRLDDSLPDAVTFRSVSTDHGTCGGITSAFCEIGALDPGEIATIEVVVGPACTTPMPMFNHIEVSSGTRDPDKSNNVSDETTLLNQSGC